MIKEISSNNELYKGKTERCQYIIIGDHIYYHGDVEELDNFLERAHSFEKVNYKLIYMNDIKLGDLRVIFGHPYLYRHLGGCDHMICFREARIFMKNDEYQHDVVERAVYPYEVFESKMKKKRCDGCQL